MSWPWAPDNYDSGDWTRDNLGSDQTTPNDLVTDPNYTDYPDESRRSWAGNSEWQGIPYALDSQGNRGSDVTRSKDSTTAGLSKNAGLKKLDVRKIKFNPPLHENIRPTSSAYNPPYGDGDIKQVWENPDARDKKDWRLGTLIGTNEVLSAYKDEPDKDYRYGFRFLYNPTTISMVASVNKDISPQAQKDASGMMLITASGIGTISMELLLNRIPEVNEKRKDKELTEEQKDLRDRGTIVDLDYLFRVPNGTWGIASGYGAPSVKAKVNKGDKATRVKDAVQTEYVNQSGDIGIVIPTPMWLTLGPGLRYYGWLQSVDYNHTMFNEDMVPMLTRVKITFQRAFLGTPSEVDSLNEAASQYGVISGDVFAPPPDADPTATEPGSGEGGQYPEATQWEKQFFSQNLPGPREGYKNVVAAVRAIRAEFPQIKIIGGWRPSDPYPDHPSGLALDIMIPQGCVSSGPGKELGDDIARFFMNQTDTYAVKYMIWQQRIWNAEEESPKPVSQWRGMSPRGSCTADHKDHVHLALLPYPNDQGWAGSSPGHSTNSWNEKKGTYWASDISTGGGGSVSGMAGSLPQLAGTPAQIGQKIVAFAKQNGWPDITFDGATSADYQGHTAGSDHYGPGNVKWAGDFGTIDFGGSKKACWRLARALTQAYDIPGGPTGENRAYRNGYRLQLIWQDKDHYDHVHFGIRVENSSKVYNRTGT